MPDSAEHWLAKARQDERVAELIRQAGGPWSLAAYHLQQSAEKRLKACLVSRRIRPQKTHDLAELAESIAEDVPEALWPPLRSMSALAWTTRYPGWDEITEEQFEELLGEYAQLVTWLEALP